MPVVGCRDHTINLWHKTGIRDVENGKRKSRKRKDEKETQRETEQASIEDKDKGNGKEAVRKQAIGERI